MEFLITKNDNTEKVDLFKINELIGTKITPAFNNMLKNLKINKEMYHYDTKMKIKRIK